MVEKRRTEMIKQTSSRHLKVFEELTFNEEFDKAQDVAFVALNTLASR